MATMNISLPDRLREWVERQVATGRFANASDYVRDLIREDESRVAELAGIRTLVEEGLASGISGKRLDDIRHEVQVELGIAKPDAA